ncbi:hypothetical protein NDU88_002713 [Pleurodeles waltl]|uniref:Uncharacterized protein n=1 Tax=Pleurodeles waltl TaxID=8319 RepID=A0AAV7W0G8_PLEWA|nr:hypothetical protein NDU88_002713 [Pleurodeles waltl]
MMGRFKTTCWAREIELGPVILGTRCDEMESGEKDAARISAGRNEGAEQWLGPWAFNEAAKLRVTEMVHSTRAGTSGAWETQCMVSPV